MVHVLELMLDTAGDATPRQGSLLYGLVNGPLSTGVPDKRVNDLSSRTLKKYVDSGDQLHGLIIERLTGEDPTEFGFDTTALKYLEWMESDYTEVLKLDHVKENGNVTCDDVKYLTRAQFNAMNKPNFRCCIDCWPGAGGRGKSKGIIRPGVKVGWNIHRREDNGNWTKEN